MHAMLKFVHDLPIVEILSHVLIYVLQRHVSDICAHGTSKPTRINIWTLQLPPLQVIRCPKWRHVPLWRIGRVERRNSHRRVECHRFEPGVAQSNGGSARCLGVVIFNHVCAACCQELVPFRGLLSLGGGKEQISSVKSFQVQWRRVVAG